MVEVRNQYTYRFISYFNRLKEIAVFEKDGERIYSTLIKGKHINSRKTFDKFIDFHQQYDEFML